MSCGSKKSKKPVPTSTRKQLSNQHSNLHRFWSQLGPILGVFWRPRWGQVGTKSIPKSIFKSIIKTITFRIALGLDFDRLWAPKWPPRGAPEGPTNEVFFTFFALGAILEPRSPKTPPEPSGTDVDRFLNDFS